MPDRHFAVQNTVQLRIIGIDPGLTRTGWGVVEMSASRVTHIGNGVIGSGSGPMTERLARLFRGLGTVMEQHQPQEAAVETSFVSKDAAGALKLGQARAIALLLPGLKALPVAEYAPNHIKKSLTGSGHADKIQIQHMVQMLLPGAKLAGADSADALAAAICHAHHRQSRRLSAAEERKKPDPAQNQA